VDDKLILGLTPDAVEFVLEEVRPKARITHMKQPLAEEVEREAEAALNDARKREKEEANT
jgi:hypothetical protein